MQFLINFIRANRAPRLFANPFAVYVPETWRPIRNLASVVNRKQICIRLMFFMFVFLHLALRNILGNSQNDFQKMFHSISQAPIAFRENLRFYDHFLSSVVEFTKAKKTDSPFAPLSKDSVTFLRLLCDKFCHHTVFWSFLGICKRVESGSLTTTLPEKARKLLPISIETWSPNYRSNLHVAITFQMCNVW